MAHRLNLIPTDILEAEEWRKTLVLCGRTVLFGILVISAAYGTSRLWIASLSKEVEHLRQETAFYQNIDQKLGGLQAQKDRLIKIEQTYQNLMDKGSSGPILTELSQAIPQGVRLSRLEIEAPDQVILQGQAMSNTDLAEFLARLNRSTRLPKSVLSYSRAQSIEQEKTIAFEIRQNRIHAAER